MPLDEMIPAAEPSPVLVLIMKILEYIVLIALAGGLIFGVIYGCIRISRGFKTSFVDRRDLVENLPEDERTTVRERAQKRDRPGFLDRSPTAAVRRKYRKTLLHAAKEPPARWMSPPKRKPTRSSKTMPCTSSTKKPGTAKKAVQKTTSPQYKLYKTNSPWHTENRSHGLFYFIYFCTSGCSLRMYRTISPFIE